MLEDGVAKGAAVALDELAGEEEKTALGDV
jgi:hypothetical protein